MAGRSIIYLQYTNPAIYPPLEQSGMILHRAGWNVRYIGIESGGASNNLVFPQPLSNCTVLWKYRSPGWRQKLHFAAFTLAAFWKVFQQQPNWVYCSDLMSCPAAWLVRKFTRCKVLYHEHDSPDTGQMLKAETLKPENWPDKQKSEIEKPETGKQNGDFSFQVSRFQLFLFWFRRQVGRNAHLVVFPNAKRLEFLSEECGRKKLSHVVFNCPRREEATREKRKVEMLKAEMVPGEITDSGLHEQGIAERGNEETKAQRAENGVLRLAFHGSINSDRLPMALLDAMRQLTGRVHLTVVGYETIGSKEYMAKFLDRADSLGLRQAVNYMGALPRGETLEHALKCDVGVAFTPLQDGDVNMTNMTGASNKPFDYLACGLALLVSARPDWENMFIQPGYGLACDPFNADSIADQLNWFLEHPAETREMGERGRQRILEDWHYETQFAPVLKVLKESK